MEKFKAKNIRKFLKEKHSYEEAAHFFYDFVRYYLSVGGKITVCEDVMFRGYGRQLEEYVENLSASYNGPKIKIK